MDGLLKYLIDNKAPTSTAKRNTKDWGLMPDQHKEYGLDKKGNPLTKNQRFGRHRSASAMITMLDSGMSRQEYADLGRKEKVSGYRQSPTGKAIRASYDKTPEGRATNRMNSSKSQGNRKPRTPRWIRDKHYQPDNDAMKDTYRTASRTGKAVDHGLPLVGKQVSGLDVPSNLMGMDPIENIKKGNRLPDDFLNWEWKHDNTMPGSTRKGRLSAYRPAGTFGPVPDVAPNEMVRVPRSQGGHLNPSAFNHPTAKNIGKMGLLGAGEMALNHFWPDNPVAASREKGYDTIKSLGLDLDGAIQGIESTPLQVAARLGQGLLVDPLVTAFGAGNWVGDKINNMFSKD